MLISAVGFAPVQEDTADSLEAAALLVFRLISVPQLKRVIK